MNLSTAEKISKITQSLGTNRQIMYSIFKCQITKNIKLQYNVKLLCAKLHYALRWDMGDEKISSYAHKSSLDKYFSKISHEQN